MDQPTIVTIGVQYYEIGVVPNFSDMRGCTVLYLILSVVGVGEEGPEMVVT